MNQSRIETDACSIIRNVLAHHPFAVNDIALYQAYIRHIGFRLDIPFYGHILS